MANTEHSGLISIIMPAYNCERTVEDAVSSVLAQTYQNWELIIVDDASTDRTHDVCRELSGKDSRIRLITNQSNCGTLISRLNAIGVSEGEWIAFIDADDLWDKQKLEKQIRLRDETGCDIVYTGSAFIDENGNKIDWILHVPVRSEYSKLLKQNIISNSSVMVRKGDFIEYSPTDESKHDMHEDFACWLLMLRDGRTAAGIDEPLITYRVSKGSSSGNKLKASELNMNTYKYIGLGFFARCFYQTCYAVNGFKKYRHLR